MLQVFDGASFIAKKPAPTFSHDALKPGCNRPNLITANRSVQACNLQICDAAPDHAERFGSAPRKVKTAAANEGAAVIDAHDDRSPSGRICDL